MAPTLASIDLLVLHPDHAHPSRCSPRRCRAPGHSPAIALLIVQSFAVHQMDLQPFEPGVPRSGAIVHTVAEAVARSPSRR